MMTIGADRLIRDIKLLSVGYPLSVSDDLKWITVHNFKLPPGFNFSHTDILVEIPQDYPCSPPGVGTHVYLPPNIQFNGRPLQDLHPGTNPGWGDWAWLCYQWIEWDATKDDLVSLMEMIRTDLTNPKTQ